MSSHRPFAGRRRKDEDEGGKTKTACYARQDLCGSALSSRFIVRQCRDNGETMAALRRLPGGTENGPLSFPVSFFVPPAERAGRTPGEKMSVTMDL